MTGDEGRMEFLEALTQKFAKLLKRRALSSPESAFLGQIAVDWRAEELPELDLDGLAAVLADFWRLAEGAPPSEPTIRLQPGRAAGARALRLDLLEIVQEDRPFLVDSVLGELAETGLEVRAMFHPVVALGGREVSLILVALAPVGEDRRGSLIDGLKATLADVAVAVRDFEAMTGLMGRTALELKASAPARFDLDLDENIAFLEWLTADRFVFLGARIYDYPRTSDGGYAAEEPGFSAADGLGVLRDPALSVLRTASEPALLASQLKTYLESAAPLGVATSNLQSRVHRRAPMDYVGVKRYGPDGAAVGEVRFVGLFTLEAYESRLDEIPMVRRKAAQVMARLGENPSTHTVKRLRNILETYPRDELFQIDEEDLYATCMGILHLYDRPRVRLFERRDTFGRFLSALLYIPRDRYDSAVAAAAGEMIAAAWGGYLTSVQPNFSADPLARVHFIIAIPQGAAAPDHGALEAALADRVRTWSDRFESLVREGAAGAGRVAEVLERYAAAFPAGYRDRNDAAEALIDLEVAESLNGASRLKVRAYRRTLDGPLCFRFKLYHLSRAVPLADVLPILENMGLKALTEDGFPLQRRGAEPVWVHEFELEDARGEKLVFADVQEPFETTFAAVWEGLAENDAFNRLVIELGISWREASLVRAFARYRQQSGLEPSQSVQTETLAAYPWVVRLILELFMIKFNPAIQADAEARTQQADALFAGIEEALQSVESLDADRVLRRLALLVRAMTRTNYYQRDGRGLDKDYISFKVASQSLVDLPAPRPYREIFVCSPEVEGVHLRFGPVARGGLRWSDRRDDFRTEVLGLVKAQQVKNAVIVPVGAKGGFYPKRLTRGASMDEARAIAVAAYKTFLSGLLDITDNYDARGRLVRPPAVVAHDADDPYLVVAADKGTATFSDIANGVAADYGFWLGDAFASGGSVGYDHKAMGITARGAWEAVKRHFRELGKDIQTESFTCIGVGDMSGDVFGNGALLSRAMKLTAAFDHRHIFIDPDPDPASSWAERARLFALPRSSWADYDPTLISRGGGVYPRAAKTVPITPEARALLGLVDLELSPAELMRAILKAEAELLYLGGIGTYVKAMAETHADVGDKANDAVRVDAGELRVKVVGEGANLGFTQAGRIAFARQGGRIDTDAIDNSAGVDTSDHEVNIKILVGQIERAGRLKPQEREPLLFSMTEQVGEHVLAHNVAQTLALSLQEASAVVDLDAQGRFMLDLEARGRLDRRVEGLPRVAAVADLKAAGRGLTRPEIAVIMAYGKLELSADIVAGGAPDDPYFDRALLTYFPDPLAAFEREMKRHRLRREIVATILANGIIDLLGPTFPSRLRGATGCTTDEMVVAFEAARQMLRLDEWWRAVGALDLKAPAAGQLALYQEIALVLRGLTFWLARKAAKGAPRVQKLIDAYRPTADALIAEGGSLLSPFENAAAAARMRRFMEAGAPGDLAEAVAALRPQTTAVDIADLAAGARWDAPQTARLYHAVGETFGFERLRAAAASIAARDDYERQAVRELVLEIANEQASRVRAVMAGARKGPHDLKAAIASWIQPRKASVDRGLLVIADIEAAADGWSFPKLSIATAAVKAAAASSSSV